MRESQFWDLPSDKVFARVLWHIFFSRSRMFLQPGEAAKWRSKAWVNYPFSLKYINYLRNWFTSHWEKEDVSTWTGHPVLYEAQKLEIYLEGCLVRIDLREKPQLYTCFLPNWGNSDECAKRTVSRMCGKQECMRALLFVPFYHARYMRGSIFVAISAGNNCFPGILRLLQTWIAVSPIILLAKPTFMGESHPQVISHPTPRVGYNGTKGGLIFHVELIAPNKFPPPFPRKKKERKRYLFQVSEPLDRTHRVEEDPWGALGVLDKKEGHGVKYYKQSVQNIWQTKCLQVLDLSMGNKNDQYFLWKITPVCNKRAPTWSKQKNHNFALVYV